MYNISSDILTRFQSGSRKYARLTYGNNSIENDRIVQNSFSINRYVATGESIGIGSTVAAELDFVLRNGDGAYSNVDFLGVEMFVEVGVKDANEDIQYIPFGYYTVEEYLAAPGTISLSLLDRMMKFEQTVGTITFPITVNNLLAAACTACSVPLDSSVTGLVNGSYSVTGLPDSVKTWREVLQWICEITGTNAWITRDGKLMLSWFATTSSMSLTTANRRDSSVGKDIISLTGVTILSNDTKYTAGTNTRPLIITDNGLISHDHQTVANAINTARNGYSYSSFNATVLPCPHLDPMDVITFVKGSSNILCPVTDITFKLNGMTSLGCKSDQIAHGRSYGLQDATFYAHNIAANSILADKIAAGAITTAKLAAGAVTADKISVTDLQALGATIGGWTITNNALEHYYTDEVNGKQYLLRFISPIYGANTQGIEVLARDYPSGAFENMFAVKYTGKMIAKDADVEGKITATSGLIGNISISNGAIESQNGAFKVDATGNIESTGGTIGGLTIESNKLYKTNPFNPDMVAYADGLELHGGYEPYIATGGRTGRLIGNAEPEVISMLADRWGLNIEYGTDYRASDGKYYIDTDDSLYGNTLINGRMISIVGRAGTGETYIDNENLRVKDHDLLRLTPHFAQMFATNIQANSDLNTPACCAVGQYYVGSDATVATLSNCPTTVAFSMTVCAPIQTSYDNESSAWVYRVRTIVNMSGEKWVQYCYSSTGGTWNYGGWRKVLTDNPSTYPQTNITSATDANLSLTSNFGGNWYRKSGNVVEINLSVSGAAGEWRTVTTLPTAYRPAVDRYFSALTLSYGVGAIYVSSAGLLRVRTASGSGTVGGCITYIV